MRYGIGVGREGFTWAGAERITRMAEWPDWHPPAEMIERQPYLPRFMAGGEGNPLGARALYLGKTLYRIHGTNQPSTIGTFVSSGCIRLLNEDIAGPLRPGEGRHPRGGVARQAACHRAGPAARSGAGVATRSGTGVAARDGTRVAARDRRRRSSRHRSFALADPPAPPLYTRA